MTELSGPMVGAVTPDTAKVWLASEADRALVRCAATGGDERVAEALPIGRRPAFKLATLSGLEADTAYTYSVAIGGTDAAEGSFRTPPLSGSKARFSVGVASCIKAATNPLTGRVLAQKRWRDVLERDCALQLLVGDNVYANSSRFETLWRMHRRQRSERNFAELLRTVPTLAIWDDHDYGPNDSNGTLAGKEESLEVFRDVWANPGYGRDDDEGVYFTYEYGDVQFFLLDNRYQRSPRDHAPEVERRMLGERQEQWLLEGLAASRAAFKVVASGSCLASGRGWNYYPSARRRITDFVREAAIPGVMWLSGDVHFSKLWKHDAEWLGYPLYEVTSSGLFRFWQSRSVCILHFDTTAPDPSVRVEFVGRSFWHAAPLGGTIRLSELQPAAVRA